MSDRFVTPRGSVLYLTAIQGKPYLQVQERLIWFREEHPKGRIETSLVSRSATETVARAVIFDQEGRALASAHKTETKASFEDHTEKAETGAIGRALALCGYGTQFTALEFAEGDRLADAPMVDARAKEPPQEKTIKQIVDTGPGPITPKVLAPMQKGPPISPGDHVIKIGKNYVGRAIKDIPRKDLEGFVKWIQSSSAPNFREGPAAQEFLFYAETYLQENTMSEAPNWDDDLDQALSQRIDDPMS